MTNTPAFLSGHIDHHRAAALDVLQGQLASAGWELVHLDLDLTGTSPKVEIKLERGDGRWLLARIDRIGRCSVERFARSRSLGMNPCTRGRRPLAPQVDDQFLGRARISSPGGLIDYVAGYIANNSGGRAPVTSMQPAWRALLAPDS